MEKTPLIKALQNKALYDHPIQSFKLMETHISWVLLTGPFAYKIKKPVTFNFLDYSTLKKRQRFCQEEFKLNQPLAKDLYVDVVAITGNNLHDLQFKSLTKVSPKGLLKTNPIEYAIKMRQFKQTHLLKALFNNSKMTKKMVEEIANTIAEFHLKTRLANASSHYGDPFHIKEAMEDNFKDCLKIIKDSKRWIKSSWKPSHFNPTQAQKKLKLLYGQAKKQFKQHLSLFEKRKQTGFIRNCHGDLHLGNIVYYHSKILIFDRIEFNPDFRWIDVMNEIAFLIMDIEQAGNYELANSLLNQYLRITGDYEGLALLKFYKAYRAMVRAKIALQSIMSVKQGNTTQVQSNPEQALLMFQNYLQYTQHIFNPPRKSLPKLIILTGISGSGKTTISKKAAPHFKAIHLQSDIERKRLFKKNLYTPQKSKATYDRLYSLADTLLHWGHFVLIDATFLYASHRKRFYDLSKKHKATFIILKCEAKKSLLSRRIQKRHARGKDASDATLAVIEKQLKTAEPLTQAELAFTLQWPL